MNVDMARLKILWINYLHAAYASVANVVIFQMQDVLKVGNIGRMNLPSSMGTNWRWRMTKNQFGDKEVERLRYLTDIYGR